MSMDDVFANGFLQPQTLQQLEDGLHEEWRTLPIVTVTLLFIQRDNVVISLE